MKYGFERVERLRGNTGYIAFRGFFGPELGADAVASAMNVVAGTDALIIDLQQTGGGDPEMVALICSYLFGPSRLPLFRRFYWREGNRTEEFNKKK